MNRDHGNDSGDQDREDQRWRDEEADVMDERAAIEAFHQALHSADFGHDCDDGWIDDGGWDRIPRALLAAGWTPPAPA